MRKKFFILLYSYYFFLPYEYLRSKCEIIALASLLYNRWINRPLRSLSIIAPPYISPPVEG